MLAGPPDFAEIRQQVVLLAIEGQFLQHLAITDHRIQRRAQLMAHVRQEGAFGAVGFFGRVFGADQLPFDALLLGHILGQPDVSFQHARAVPHFGRREQHGDRPAGFGAISAFDGAAPRRRFALQNHLSGGTADQLLFGVAEQSQRAGVDPADLQIRVRDQQGFLHGTQNVIHIFLSPLAGHSGSQHACGRPEAIPLGFAPLALAPMIFKAQETEPATRHFYGHQNYRLRRVFIRRRSVRMAGTDRH